MIAALIQSFAIALAYFLPTLIVVLRNHHQAGAISVFNLLLGWTILGWIVALIWSLTATPRRYEPRTG